MSRGRIRRNDYYEAAVSILTEMGLSFREQAGRKHGKIYVTIGDVERLIPISGSPSDRRGILNFKAEVKRNIRTWKAEAEGLVATPASAQLPTLEKEAMDDSTAIAERSSNVLYYEGHLIRDRGDMLNLTDMWEAAGRSEMKRPARWLESQPVRDFVECVAANNIGNSDIIVSTRGRNGGTFAHWQIGLAYAKYLSNEFHMWCNDVVRQHMADVGSQPLAPSTQMSDDIGAVVDLMSEFNAIVVAMQSRVDAIHDLLAAGDAVNVPVLRQQLWAAVKWEDQQFRAALNETVRAVLGGQKKVLANPDTWRKAGVLPAPHGEDHEFCTTYELLCEVFEPDRIHARLTTWVTNEILMPAARDGLWPQGRTPVRSRSDRPLVTFPLVRAREYLQRKDVRKKVQAKNEELARGSVQGVVIDMFAGRE